MKRDLFIGSHVHNASLLSRFTHPNSVSFARVR